MGTGSVGFVCILFLQSSAELSEYQTNIERVHSRVQHPCKFIGAKESVYIRNELHSHRIGLVQQHEKRKCLHKKRVELSQDWFGTTTWKKKVFT